MSVNTERDQVSQKLWEVAEHTIITEWICCEPIDPNHSLCVQGDATLTMVKALLIDDPQASRTAAPLLDVVMRLMAAHTQAAAQKLLDMHAEALILHGPGVAQGLLLAYKTVAPDPYKEPKQ